jgi:hypothetical protein
MTEATINRLAREEAAKRSSMRAVPCMNALVEFRSDPHDDNFCELTFTGMRFWPRKIMIHGYRVDTGFYSKSMSYEDCLLTFKFLDSNYANEFDNLFAIDYAKCNNITGSNSEG